MTLNKKLKIFFSLGSRSDWGYIRPVIEEATKRKHDASILACNMSVLYAYGNLIKQIEEESYNVGAKFYTSIEGSNYVSMAKSVGQSILSYSDYLANNKPDWVVVPGDRAEQLGVTIASSFLYIPIAHIQAGERSGSIDGQTRHAITRFSHIHLASNEDARLRLTKFGEETWRIIETGAPQLDDINKYELLSKVELSNKNLCSNAKFILCVFHSDTESQGEDLKSLTAMMDAIKTSDLDAIWIGPNNDAGGTDIKRYILDNLRGRDKYFSNLSRADYLSLLKNSEAIIGNSSSGILEAPTFKKPAINLGRRQALRFRAENVIDVGSSFKEITEALMKAQDITFLKGLNSDNPYGKGDSSQKILDALEKYASDPRLLRKQIVY